MMFLESELNAQGKKIARLKGNRNLKESSIKDKMKSLKNNGQLVPAIIVEAIHGINQGLELIDWQTGNDIIAENASNYFALIDGQHRFEAHNRLRNEDPDYSADFVFIESLNPQAAVSKQLLEINTSTRPWDGADYAKTAIAFCETPEQYPGLTFLAELTGQGYSLPSASGWTSMSDKITKPVLVSIAAGKGSKAVELLKNQSSVERGRALHDAAEQHFGLSFRQGRLLIDWIKSQYESTPDLQKPEFTTRMVGFINSFTRRKAEDIEAIKGTRGGETRETIVNRSLSEAYSNYMQSHQE